MSKIVKVASWITKSLLTVTRVDEQVRNERLAVCNSCPQLDNLRRCKICKCFVDSKTISDTYRDPADLKIKHAYCPEAKWDEARDNELINFYKPKSKNNGKI